MKTYTIQVAITKARVSFEVRAKSMDEALSVGREELKNTVLFSNDVEVIVSLEEITGVYECHILKKR